MRKTFVVMPGYVKFANVEVAVIFWLLGNEAFETALRNFFFFFGGGAFLLFDDSFPSSH